MSMMASRQRLPTYIPNSVAQLIGYMQYSFPGKFLTKVILQLLTRLFVEDPLRVLTAFFFLRGVVRLYMMRSRAIDINLAAKPLSRVAYGRIT